MTGDEKHGPAATSTLDVVWVLYDRVLRIDPHRLDDPRRDRFYLSKGHGPMAFYAVLAAKGILDVDLLTTFGAFDSPLGYHPDRNLLPGVEISSGSLGHGLPLAVGTVIGNRARDLQGPRVFVLVGDGELEEGSNYEAIAFATYASMHELTVVVVDNTSTALAAPDGIRRRFAAEGWAVTCVDGRDHEALHRAFTLEHADRPHVVIAAVEPKETPGGR
ncbi:MAG TPA: transketolase [Micromonosporaceae bacterium]